MSDRVILSDLEVWCVIGTLEGERTREQPLRIDLEITADLAPAGATDDLSKTLDYAALASDIEAIARKGRFRLIEALGEAIAAHCLDTGGAGIREVRVRVKKPGAIRHARFAGVEIVRRLE